MTTDKVIVKCENVEQRNKVYDWRAGGDTCIGDWNPDCLCVNLSIPESYCREAWYKEEANYKNHKFISYQEWESTYLNPKVVSIFNEGDIVVVTSWHYDKNIELPQIAELTKINLNTTSLTPYVINIIRHNRIGQWYFKEGEFRKATKEEEEAYNKGIRNIKDIPKEAEFEVGKWYRLGVWISKFKRIEKETQFWAENINTETKYHDKEGYLYLSNYTPVLITDLSEIQEFLPSGHPDKVVKEFVLPEKWCVKVNTDKERELASTWRQNHKGTQIKLTSSGYIRSTPEKGMKRGYHSNEKPDNHTEITFDQFKKYVLKEPQVMENKIPEYVELCSGWSVNNEYLGEVFELSTLNNLSKFDQAPSKESFRKHIEGWIRTGLFKPSTKEAFDAQNKPKEVINTYGLKVGDKLETKVIDNWASINGNFCSDIKDGWKSTFNGYGGNREIAHFRVINGIVGFKVSNCATDTHYLRAEGFKEFMDNFDKPKIVMKYKIGDEVIIKNINNYKTDHYSNGSIPTEKIIHGSATLHSIDPKAKIVDIYNGYYIVNFLNRDANTMQLGFPEKDLELKPIPKEENLVGRWVKALVDKPCGGFVKKGEYAQIKKDFYADFPSQSNYGLYNNLSYWEGKLELMPVGFTPETVKKDPIMVIDEFYVASNGNIFQWGGSDAKYSFGMKDHIPNVFFSHAGGAFQQKDFRLATADEKAWLQACIKANKYMTKEEALKEKWIPQVGDWVVFMSEEAKRLSWYTTTWSKDMVLKIRGIRGDILEFTAGDLRNAGSNPAGGSEASCSNNIVCFRKAEAWEIPSYPGTTGTPFTVDFNYIPKVGDVVRITRSTRNWATKMSSWDGKEVTVTETRINNGKHCIRFKDDGGWSWVYEDSHFQPISISAWSPDVQEKLTQQLNKIQKNDVNLQINIDSEVQNIRVKETVPVRLKSTENEVNIIVKQKLTIKI